VRAFSLLLVLLGLTTDVAFAEPKTLDAQVAVLLEAGVESAVPRDALLALGPEVPAALMRIWHGTEHKRHVRLRALSALSGIDEPAVRRFFATLLRGYAKTARPDPDPLHPSRSSLALRRVIEATTTLKLTGLEPELSFALGHRDSAVRRAAVLGLIRLDTRKARAALDRHAQLETASAVKALLRDRPAARAALPPIGPKSAPPPR
jgi:hypothetical protein